MKLAEEINMLGDEEELEKEVQKVREADLKRA